MFISLMKTLKKIYFALFKRCKHDLEFKEHTTSKSILDLTKNRIIRYNILLYIVSLIGPIILPLISEGKTLAVKIVFIVIFSLIICILILVLNIYYSISRSVENSEQFNQKQIESLNNEIQSLRKQKEFYQVSLQMLEGPINRYQYSLETLSKYLVASVYNNLVGIASDDDITINIYELKNHRIKMITANTRLRHFSRDDRNVPILYTRENGMSINDYSINDYYSIKCIRGKIKTAGKENVFILPNWKDIANEFKWDGWTESERDEIVKSNDRNRCLQCGFKYNQYFSFMIEYRKNVKIYFEMIANGNTEFAPESKLVEVALSLKELYSPMLIHIWDIANKII